MIKCKFVARHLYTATSDLVDLLGEFGHYDAGYCESCDQHPPKDHRSGEIIGTINHKPDCIIGAAIDALEIADAAGIGLKKSEYTRRVRYHCGIPEEAADGN